MKSSVAMKTCKFYSCFQSVDNCFAAILMPFSGSFFFLLYVSKNVNKLPFKVKTAICHLTSEIFKIVQNVNIYQNLLMTLFTVFYAQKIGNNIYIWQSLSEILRKKMCKVFYRQECLFKVAFLRAYLHVKE